MKTSKSIFSLTNLRFGDRSSLFLVGYRDPRTNFTLVYLYNIISFFFKERRQLCNRNKSIVFQTKKLMFSLYLSDASTL